MSCPLCATLRAERDEALEQVRQLKVRAFGPVDEVARFVAQVGLTRSEATIVSVLLHHDAARVDAITDALYFDDPNGGSGKNTIAVLIVKIRRKFAPLGIAIRAVRGLGWRMDAENKAKLRAAAGLAA